MASPGPVPSRAALHALRGVILTTSCSVALLAEERRRRLKVARAAIENARRLHTVSHVRASLTTTDVMSGCESGLAPLNDCGLAISSLPRPRTSTRRRRRSAHSSFSTSNHPTASVTAEAYVEREVDSVTERRALPRSSPAPQRLQSWASELFDVGALTQTQPRVPPKSPPSTFKSTSSFYKSPPARIPSLPRHSSIPRQTSDLLRPSSIAEARLQKDTAFGGDKTTIPELSHTFAAIQVLTARPLSADPIAFWDEAHPLLQGLQLGLKAQRLERHLVLESISSATDLLKSLASRGRASKSMAKRLDFSGVDLLKTALEHDQEKAKAITRSLLRLNKNPAAVLLALAGFKRNGGSICHLADALDFLADPKRERRWIGGMQIHTVLMERDKPTDSYRQTKMLYQAMIEAGLFRNGKVSSATERNIRSLMILRATASGDDSLVESETLALQKLSPRSEQFNILEQCGILINYAVLGEWESVQVSLEALRERSGVECVELQNAIVRITDIFARNHTFEQLEDFLHRLAPRFDVKLKRRWIYHVFDGYVARRHEEAAFSWLRFCTKHGLSINKRFLEAFYIRCRNFWSYSDKGLLSLESRVKTFIEVELGIEDYGSDNVFQSDNSPEVANRTSDMTDLRSAVVRLLNAGRSGIERAILLVQNAHDRGINISEALTPLLLARLKRGDEPTKLVDEALRMGARVHDSVYNMAARALAGKKNLSGAVAMCECAARENGKGNLLYNRYNFANLVYAYTGSFNYGALHSLLSDFTSDLLWWKGGMVCKESIKLAMKTTAMRAVVSVENRADAKQKASHKHVLRDLDAALMHVRKCRADRTLRWRVSDTLMDLIGTSYEAVPECGPEYAMKQR